MSAAAVLEKLQGVRRKGEQWMARCLAHEDKGPSLSVRDENGKVLLHCFAGCTIESICGALEIKVNDLFAEGTARKSESGIVREAQQHIAGLRSRLTPMDRERPVTLIKTDEKNLDAAIARALALAVEGGLVQVVLDKETQ